MSGIFINICLIRSPEMVVYRKKMSLACLLLICIAYTVVSGTESCERDQTCAVDHYVDIVNKMESFWAKLTSFRFKQNEIDYNHETLKETMSDLKKRATELIDITDTAFRLVDNKRRYNPGTSVFFLHTKAVSGKESRGIAKAACKAKGAHMATFSQILQANKFGLDVCSCGWIWTPLLTPYQAHRAPVYPRQGCTGDTACGRGTFYGVYCFKMGYSGPTTPHMIGKWVFLLTSSSQSSKLSFNYASALCQSSQATVATYDQLKQAYLYGLDMCRCGWLANKTAYYPVQWPRERCGNTNGIVQCEPESAGAVYCFKVGYKGPYTNGFLPN